ncbi:pVI [Ovine adenovirus 7]|uniref:PVI n=1 Tax=Ovine adenovirus D serotype 7 (isolate OAV287) TaxID=114430 RepID=Q83904_ADEO7|nr:pVI [Ovine adenovirus 7]AAA84978.1 pVI [Ovine adenovirus 7]
MAFSRLAPHCGLTPVYGHTVGICDMRGGFSWSSLGNSFTSGLRNIGSFISNTAQKIGQSQGFQQAKQGLLQSNVLENAGQLAGQTLNTLVDIGRLKVEKDLEKLKQKVIGNDQQITQEQLAQLIASLKPKDEMFVKQSEKIVEPMRPEIKSSQMPVEMSFYDSVSDEPIIKTKEVSPPSFSSESSHSYSHPRKRKRVSGWGAFLDNMTGDGVNFNTRRYCY